MKNSVSFWLFALVSGLAFRAIPFFHEHYWIRILVWLCFMRLFKRSWFFYRQLPPWVRCPDKQTIVVTGASSGIGAEVAKQLMEKGAKVILAARNTEAAEKAIEAANAKDGGVQQSYVLALDLANLASIREFANAVKKRENTITGLILNAGYHGPRATTKDGFERSIGVNHLGHMYLTYLLTDQLKASAPSRIVVVASDLHKLCPNVRFHDLMFQDPQCYGYAGFSAYNHSKLCNMLFARELSRRLSDTNVAVCAAHPGTPVQTNLMRNNFLGGALMNKVLLPPLYYLYCRQPSDGAQTIIHCALSQHVHGRYYELTPVPSTDVKSTSDISRIVSLPRNLAAANPSKAAQNDETSRRLWDISCGLLKIGNNWV